MIFCSRWVRKKTLFRLTSFGTKDGYSDSDGTSWVLNNFCVSAGSPIQVTRFCEGGQRQFSYLVISQHPFWKTKRRIVSLLRHHRLQTSQRRNPWVHRRPWWRLFHQDKPVPYDLKGARGQKRIVPSLWRKLAVSLPWWWRWWRLRLLSREHYSKRKWTFCGAE
jgi:hypothetical protein